jgi:hypothetical protein
VLLLKGGDGSTQLGEHLTLAASPDFTLRSSAAMLLWHRAKNHPGRVPVPLLSRLSLPSQEGWYVYAAARAGAKTCCCIVFPRV